MTKGIFDETFGDGTQQVRYASDEHKHAADMRDAESNTAKKMFPEMAAVQEREAEGGYSLMNKQRADAENEAQAQFELTMQTEQGAVIRQAAREEIDTLMKQARSYPSHRESVAEKIEEIENKFGDWLTVA